MKTACFTPYTRQKDNTSARWSVKFKGTTKLIGSLRAKSEKKPSNFRNQNNQFLSNDLFWETCKHTLHVLKIFDER